ncbi:primosomal replication protein PriC [Serratia microhaemolytica]|uniref:primosomal replication protein PriC n=1 Tax=Serratia microhaemolytica TaxID=2675110 RepID=UPI000FDF32A9|nr:primosomal replication protein [Serratia microhaemolytica]
MNSQLLLQTLSSQLVLLAQAVEPYADSSVQQARFDVLLFACRGTRLRDYLAEVEKNFAQLQIEVANKHHAQVAFLAEKLVAQLSALQREIATQSIREKNQPRQPQVFDLYQKLAEHQGYERRLLAMLQDRESLLARQTTLAEQRKLQQELAALEGRLQRCRQALARIERSIEGKESNS